MVGICRSSESEVHTHIISHSTGPGWLVVCVEKKGREEDPRSQGTTDACQFGIPRLLSFPRLPQESVTAAVSLSHPAKIAGHRSPTNSGYFSIKFRMFHCLCPQHHSAFLSFNPLTASVVGCWVTSDSSSPSQPLAYLGHVAFQHPPPTSGSFGITAHGLEASGNSTPGLPYFSPPVDYESC